jgi:hypothetical protein
MIRPKEIKKPLRKICTYILENFLRGLYLKRVEVCKRTQKGSFAF